MKNDLIEDMLHNFAELQRFDAPQDALSSLLANYLQDEELQESELDLITAAGGTVKSYQEFIRLAKNRIE